MSIIMAASIDIPASNVLLGRCVGMHPNYISFSDDEIEHTASWLAGFCGGKKLCKKFPCIAMRALDARLLEHIREVNATKVTQKFTMEEHTESENFFKSQDQAEEKAIADAMADDSTIDTTAPGGPSHSAAASSTPPPLFGGASHSATTSSGYDVDRNPTTDDDAAMPDMSSATI